MGSLGIVLWFLVELHSSSAIRSTFNVVLFLPNRSRGTSSTHIYFTPIMMLLQSVRYYLIDCIDIVGPILFGLGVSCPDCVSLAPTLQPRKCSQDSPFWCRFRSTLSSLFSGQASLSFQPPFLGYAPYQLFNARYGEVVVVPAAIFLASFSILPCHVTAAIAWKALVRTSFRAFCRPIYWSSYMYRHCHWANGTHYE